MGCGRALLDESAGEGGLDPTVKRSRCLVVGASERGAGLVEYALLVALIVLVCIAAVELLGSSTDGIYSSAVSGLNG